MSFLIYKIKYQQIEANQPPPVRSGPGRSGLSKKVGEFLQRRRGKRVIMLQANLLMGDFVHRESRKIAAFSFLEKLINGDYEKLLSLIKLQRRRSLWNESWPLSHSHALSLFQGPSFFIYLKNHSFKVIIYVFYRCFLHYLKLMSRSCRYILWVFVSFSIIMYCWNYLK